MSEEDWYEVVCTAATLLSHLPDPSRSAGVVTALALGKVQSGKTLSYSALIALAAENGYRVTVVLAGTKKPLLEQTFARLRSDLGAPGRTIVMLKQPRHQDVDVLRSVLHCGTHAIIVCLKHPSRIEDVRRVLAAPDLGSFPTLIIDDEGDEASLNTQFRQGRASATYRSILSLRAALPLHAYVAYTATPQANLLIDGIDSLSPDVAVLLEPGSGYCGGSVFFGERRDLYVRQIPVDEGDPARSAVVTDALRFAVAVFVVGAAIRRIRHDSSGHSMLVHTSSRTADHRQLYDALRLLLRQWCDTLQLRDDDPELRSLRRLLEAAYDDLCQSVVSPPPFSNVYAAVRDELWLTEVWMVNSLPIGRDPIQTPFRLSNNILVGGNMLGRGVTVPELAVTYITREAQQDTNADTLEQRARWFGYKEAYLDLCRIFLTPQLRDRYTELLKHEDDFWEALRRNQRQGLPVKQWPRMFRLDMVTWRLRPTRPAVANFRCFSSTGWDVQRRLVEDPVRAGRNVDVVRRFFQDGRCEVRAYGSARHLVRAQCDTATVITELLARLDSDGTDWEASYTIEYLTRLLLQGTLPAIDVVLMCEGDPELMHPRVRTKRQGSINPMQGRSPGRADGDPGFYPGDEYIHGGRPQLQVHLISLRGEDIPSPVTTTALALYIPSDDPSYDLKMVVRG